MKARIFMGILDWNMAPKRVTQNYECVLYFQRKYVLHSYVDQTFPKSFLRENRK